jgi:hypothetical protein
MPIIRDTTEPRGRIRPLIERDPVTGARRKPARDQHAFRYSRSRSPHHYAGAGPAAINIGEAVDPGIRPDLVGVYANTYSGVMDKLRSYAVIDIAGTGREDLFAYAESLPYPTRQDRGRAPYTEGLRYVNGRIRHYAYALRMGVHVDDIDDDRTGQAAALMASTAQQFATLPERLVFQLITNTTDADLLPALPTAFDGTSLYNASNGAGGDRFGVSGGNIVTGAASPAASDIREAIFDAHQRWIEFEDTKGEPLIDPSVLSEGIVVLYGPSINQEIAEAFVQARTLETSSSGTDFAAAAVSNVIMDAGIKYQLIESPRISTNDIYLFLQSSRVARPIVYSTRRELYTVTATEETSDYARDTNELFEQSRIRLGVRPVLPFGTLKINNS